MWGWRRQSSASQDRGLRSSSLHSVRRQMSIVQATWCVVFCHGSPSKPIRTPRVRPLAIRSLPNLPGRLLAKMPLSARASTFSCTEQQSPVTHLGADGNNKPFSAQTQSRPRSCSTSFVPASRGALWGVRPAAVSLGSGSRLLLPGAVVRSSGAHSWNDQGLWAETSKPKKTNETHRLLCSRGFQHLVALGHLSSKDFIWEHRGLNIFNGIAIRFLRLWCASLYKGRPAPALSLKIPCPHLFPCLLSFSFYITSPLNTS